MVRMNESQRYSFKNLAAVSNNEQLRTAALELDSALGIVVRGLEMAGWEVTEETLKQPGGKAAQLPSEGYLEDSAERFVDALEQDPEFSSPAFQCLADFRKCRQSGRYHPAWCVAAMAICLAERIAPIARLGR